MKAPKPGPTKPQPVAVQAGLSAMEKKPEAVDAVALLWPRLMSVVTAAKYLDCTPWHMEELCRSGAVAAYKENGQSWSIDRLELDRYVERRKTEAQAA